MNFLTRILVALLLMTVTSATWNQLLAAEDDATEKADVPASELPQPDTPAESTDESATVTESPSPEEIPPRAAKLPAHVHSGVLASAELTQIAVSWVDLDKMLLGNQLTIDSGAVPESAVVLRSPAEGNAFLVVTVAVKAERTLSRYDYGIEVAGMSIPCLALTWGDNPYDVRRWQFSAAPDQVFLLFEVPAETPSFTLVPLLELSIPQSSLTDIPLQEEIPVVSAPTSEEGQGNDDSDTAAEDAASAEEGKPATEEDTKKATEAAEAPKEEESTKTSEPAKQEKKAPADEAGDWF